MKILIASPIFPDAIEKLREQHEIVCAFAREHPFGKQQIRGVLPIGDFEIAVEVLQTQRAREVVPFVQDFRSDQARHARAAGIGLFISIAGAEVVVSIPGARFGDSIVRADLL